MVFSLSILLLWEKWQEKSHPEAVKLENRAASAPAITPADKSAVAPVAGNGTAVATSLEKGKKIHVVTDVLDADIDTMGGDLRRLELLKYHETKDASRNYLLMQDEGGKLYVAQSGLIGNSLPNHKTLFQAEADSYALQAGADSVQVKLSAPEAGGARVVKTYTFKKGSYVVDVSYRIENVSNAALAPSAYFQIMRDGGPAEDASRFANTYTGFAVYTEKNKFVKVDFSDIDKNKINYPVNDDNGWIALIQHHFVSAWLPPQKTSREYYTRRLADNLYSAGVVMNLGKIEPGKSLSFDVPLYAGPQEQNDLAKLSPGLDLVVDYGWLTVIAKPLFWILSTFHGWVMNWGVAIIMLTIMVKLIFFPLSAASYKSMAKMRAVGPKLQAVKEQYGDDKQKLHQAMMELYKTEKINPLGGCLPMLVQIPVFISLYYVVLGTVELRGAPFALWIHDLSAQDPYYILPLIMSITMILQSRMNPAPPDPVQAKMMKIMPVAFSIFFFFFPAGLVLYWLVNNILSIAQQWYITKNVAEATPAANAKR